MVQKTKKIESVLVKVLILLAEERESTQAMIENISALMKLKEWAKARGIEHYLDAQLQEYCEELEYLRELEITIQMRRSALYD